MARTLTTAESRVYAANGFAPHLQVWIKDAGGSWVELTDLEGMDWVESVEVADDIDQPVMAASIKLLPSFYDLHLSPLVVASKINLPGGVLEERIAINREVAIRVAILPLHSGDPVDADWRLLFHGDCDQLDVATMSLQCVDLGGRLQRLKLERAGKPATSPGGGAFVEAGADYIAAATSVAAETVMQAVLDDWAPSLAITLATPVSPLWELTEAWKPSDSASVMDVLRGIASMIGWDCRYRYDSTATDPFGTPAAGGFTLQFYEPDRSNVTPVITLGPNSYTKITQLEDALATIANRVEVLYKDSVDDDARVRSVIAEDLTSQAAYGVLYMRVPVDSTTGIITQANATLLADAILHDVSDPTAAMSAEAVFRYDVEVFDLVRFSSNTSMFDSNQDLAVAGFRHSFSEGRASTQILLRGSVAGHRPWWWQVVAGDPEVANGVGDSTLANGGGHATDTAQPGTPDLTRDFDLGGLQLKVAELPPGYSVEWHLSATSGFTPSTSTLVAITKSSRFTYANVSTGTTQYAKAIAVSPTGIASAASSEVTAGVPNAADRTIFASGEDGAFDFDGTNTYATYASTTGAAPDLVYTLIRDVDATAITVRTGKTLKTGGYKIHTLLLTLAGTAVISHDGNAGANATSRTGATKQGPTSAFTLGGGVDGGDGGNGGSAGLNNDTAGNSGSSVSIGKGGAGGAGGAGSDAGGVGAQAGSAGGAASTNTAPKAITRSLDALFAMAQFVSGTLSRIGGGAGGSGGGGGGSNDANDGGGGGSGGSGGGVIFLACLAIVLESWTGTIHANGGAGGAGFTGTGGSATGDGGGGGGGGGGWVRVVYGSVTGGTLTSGSNVTATGGVGGAAGGNATAGTAGSDGTVDLINLGA